MELKEKLEQSYLDTIYSVFINNEKYDLHIGQTIPAEIEQILENKSAVILTAWNPRSQVFLIEDNMLRNLDLLRSLSNMDYLIYEALGQGVDPSWPAEMSFLIIGITQKEAENMAIEHEQYAYVWLEKGKSISLEFSDIWEQ